MPGEFNPNAIDLNVRHGSVRKESLDPEMFPFDWFEFERPPTGSPTYDKHRLKLKDFAVLQAVLEGRAFVGLDCGEDVNALDVLALGATGDVIKADKSAANTSNVIGFAATTTSSGDKVRVITGGVLDGFAGLNTNELLFLDTAGGYTQIWGDLGTGEYVVVLGVAISATEVEISISQAIIWDSYNALTYTEHQDGYTHAGGVVVPTVPTISVCEAVATKAIRIVWDRQLNLTNFDRYELQVSDDDATWYSLEVDGSGWEDTLNADTDHDVEMYIHQGIPHGGAADAPTGQTLYYKVRRVTKAAVASAYSASASATTNTVGAGDLAANSIYANNILAGAIQTMLLRSGTIWVGYDGTGTYDDPDAGDACCYIDNDELAFRYYTGAAWNNYLLLSSSGIVLRDGVDIYFGHQANDFSRIHYTGDHTYWESYKHGGEIRFYGETDGGVMTLLLTLDPDNGTKITGNANIDTLAAYANNAAAVAGGLAAGDLYRLGDTVGVVH